MLICIVACILDRDSNCYVSVICRVLLKASLHDGQEDFSYTPALSPTRFKERHFVEWQVCAGRKCGGVQGEA